MEKPKCRFNFVKMYTFVVEVIVPLLELHCLLVLLVRIHVVEGKTHNVVFSQLVLERKFDLSTDYQNKSNSGYKFASMIWIL